MSTPGQRKSAVYLASMSPSERRRVLAALPAKSVAQLQPLIDFCIQSGWGDRALVDAALADELTGLTASTTLSVEQLLKLSSELDPLWYARVLRAAGPVDHDFLLALLDGHYARRVRDELQQLTRPPERLGRALIAEAGALVAA